MLNEINFMDRESSSQKKDNNHNYAKWASLGFEFVGVLAVLSFMGYKLDEAWDTSPWFLLAGFAVGFISMLYMIFKQSWYTWRK